MMKYLPLLGDKTKFYHATVYGRNGTAADVDSVTITSYNGITISADYDLLWEGDEPSRVVINKKESGSRIYFPATIYEEQAEFLHVDAVARFEFLARHVLWYAVGFWLSQGRDIYLFSNIFHELLAIDAVEGHDNDWFKLLETSRQIAKEFKIKNLFGEH